MFGRRSRGGELLHLAAGKELMALWGEEGRASRNVGKA